MISPKRDMKRRFTAFTCFVHLCAVREKELYNITVIVEGWQAGALRRTTVHNVREFSALRSRRALVDQI
jgi:hypothetical protein